MDHGATGATVILLVDLEPDLVFEALPKHPVEVKHAKGQPRNLPAVRMDAVSLIVLVCYFGFR